MHLRNQLINIFQENRGDYERVITRVIECLRENDQVVRAYIEDETLEFLYSVKPHQFFIGHSDEFFDDLIASYPVRYATEREYVIGAVVFVYELLYYMTDELCPSCQQTNLRLFTDKLQQNIYEACIECFARRFNGEWIYNRDEIYPANKSQVQYYLSNEVGRN